MDHPPGPCTLPEGWRPVTKLSPTGLMRWEGRPPFKGPAAFALSRMPDFADPQGRPAAVGSAFDARVKAQLSADLFGYDGEAIYAQRFHDPKTVEPEHREAAGPAGDRVFADYRACGAYDALLGELRAAHAVRFPAVGTDGTPAGVPVYGVPDATWRLGGPDRGLGVVHDWKVTGLVRPASPTRGFGYCWPFGGAHVDFQSGGAFDAVRDSRGIRADWATQLTLYHWLQGEPIGSPAVCQVHELVFRGPALRVAVHRAHVSSEFQAALLIRLTRAWSYLSVGHFFPDKSPDDSTAICHHMAKLGYQRARKWVKERF